MRSSDSEAREVVNHKIRRALSVKALGDMRALVDVFEQDQRIGQRARLIAILALVILLLLAVSVIWAPAIYRLITGLIS